MCISYAHACVCFAVAAIVPIVHVFHVQVSEQACKAEQPEEPKTLEGQLRALKVDIGTAEELLAAGWQPPLPCDAEQPDQAPLPAEAAQPDQAVLSDAAALPNQAPLPDETLLPDQARLNSADMDVETPQTPLWRSKSELEGVPTPLPLPQVAPAFRPRFWCNQDSAEESASTLEEGAIAASVQAAGESEMLLPPHLRSPDVCAKVIRGSLLQQSQPMLLAEDARRSRWKPAEQQASQQQGLPGAELSQGRGLAQQPPRLEPPGLSLRHFLPDQPLSPRRHGPGPQQGERVRPAAGTQEPAASHPIAQRPPAIQHMGQPQAAPFRPPTGPAVDHQAQSAGHPRQPHPFVGPRAQPIRPPQPHLFPDSLADPTRGIPPGEQGAPHGQGHPIHVPYMSAQSLSGANGRPAQDANRFAGLCEAPSSMAFPEHLKSPSVRPLVQLRDMKSVRAGPHQAVNQAVNELINMHNRASLAGQSTEQSQREGERLRADGSLNSSEAVNHKQQPDQPAIFTTGVKRKQEGQQRDGSSTSRRIQGSSLPRVHADERPEKQSQARDRSRSVHRRPSSDQICGDRDRQQEIRVRTEHSFVNQINRQSRSLERGPSTARSNGSGHDGIRSRGPSHDGGMSGGQPPPARARTQGDAHVRQTSADLSPHGRIRTHSASQDSWAGRDSSPHGRTTKPGHSLHHDAGRERGWDRRRSLSKEGSFRDRSPGSSFREPGPSRGREAGRELLRERLRSRSLEKGSGTTGTLHESRSHQRASQGDRGNTKHALDDRRRERSHSQERRSSRDGNFGKGGPVSWSRKAKAVDWCPGDTFDHTPGETSCTHALSCLGALAHLRSR